MSPSPTSLVPAMHIDIAGLLRREVSTLVFDQYGTIVDMQGGLTAAVAPFLAGKGWTGDPHRFVAWWRRTHFGDSIAPAYPC